MITVSLILDYNARKCIKLHEADIHCSLSILDDVLLEYLVTNHVGDDFGNAGPAKEANSLVNGCVNLPQSSDIPFVDRSESIVPHENNKAFSEVSQSLQNLATANVKRLRISVQLSADELSTETVMDDEGTSLTWQTTSNQFEQVSVISSADFNSQALPHYVINVDKMSSNDADSTGTDPTVDTIRPGYAAKSVASDNPVLNDYNELVNSGAQSVDDLSLRSMLLFESGSSADTNLLIESAKVKQTVRALLLRLNLGSLSHFVDLPSNIEQDVAPTIGCSVLDVSAGIDCSIKTPPRMHIRVIRSHDTKAQIADSEQVQVKAVFSKLLGILQKCTNWNGLTEASQFVEALARLTEHLFTDGRMGFGVHTETTVLELAQLLIVTDACKLNSVSYVDAEIRDHCVHEDHTCSQSSYVNALFGLDAFIDTAFNSNQNILDATMAKTEFMDCDTDKSRSSSCDGHVAVYSQQDSEVYGSAGVLHSDVQPEYSGDPSVVSVIHNAVNVGEAVIYDDYAAVDTTVIDEFRCTGLEHAQDSLLIEPVQERTDGTVIEPSAGKSPDQPGASSVSAGDFAGAKDLTNSAFVSQSSPSELQLDVDSGEHPPDESVLTHDHLETLANESETNSAAIS